MRRAVAGFVASLALVACGEGGPTPEQTATRQALVGAHVARAAVSHLVSRYAEIVGTPVEAGGAATTWGGVTAYRGSPEGLAEGTFLAELAKPAPMDPAFPRAKDLEAVSRATADLVNLALAPTGTWEEFDGQISAIRTRLDEAVAALEKGTKSYVLIEVRSETNMQTAEYTAMLAKAKADGATAAPGTAPAP